MAELAVLSGEGFETFELIWRFRNRFPPLTPFNKLIWNFQAALLRETRSNAEPENSLKALN